MVIPQLGIAIKDYVSGHKINIILKDKTIRKAFRAHEKNLIESNESATVALLARIYEQAR